MNVPGWVMTGVEVLFGAINITPNSNQLRIISRDLLVHEKFHRPTSLENDVALIRFALPVPLSDAVKLINLPDDIFEDFAGNLATLSGWGQIRGAPPVTSPLLRYVRSPVISNALCETFYGARVFDR